MIKQLSIFLENKRGRLSTLTRILKENHVDIRALSIADSKDYGIVRLIVDDTETACNVLIQADFMLKLSEVIAIGVSDCPGGLAAVMDLMHENSIDVEYMYAFVSRTANTAYVVLRADDNQHAETVFAKNGISLLSPEEIGGEA